MWLSNWTTSSPEYTVHQQLQWSTIFYPCQGKKCIPSFSFGSHLHQNPKINSMSPEGIRLFFTNFPLVSVSQHNVNSIAIFWHNIYIHQYNFTSFYRFLCVSLTVSNIALNQSAASITLYKPWHFIFTFYSSDDSWKVLDENVWIIKATQFKRVESDNHSII